VVIVTDTHGRIRGFLDRCVCVYIGPENPTEDVLADLIIDFRVVLK
jgi:hypothetical protein